MQVQTNRFEESSRGVLLADDHTLGVVREKAGADIDRGAADDMATLYDADLGCSAPDVDVQHRLTTLAADGGCARSVGGHKCLQPRACRRADESTCQIGKEVRDPGRVV